MTTPPDDFENDAFENDPTGMRDLLRSLPEPGPMPSDVSDRISAALAAQQRERAGLDRSNVTALGSGSAARKRPGGRRWTRVAGGLVAAAAIAAVAVVGVNSLHRDDAQVVNALPSSAATTVTSHQLADRVHVTTSGTDYTAPHFNAQAASMAADNTSAQPDPAMLTRFGSLADPGAIVQCARSIGGALLDNPSSIQVDLATFDGKPAVVIVVTNHGTESAFAVSTTCSRSTRPYAAPRQL